MYHTPAQARSSRRVRHDGEGFHPSNINISFLSLSSQKPWKAHNDHSTPATRTFATPLRLLRRLQVFSTTTTTVLFGFEYLHIPVPTPSPNLMPPPPQRTRSASSTSSSQANNAAAFDITQAADKAHQWLSNWAPRGEGRGREFLINGLNGVASVASTVSSGLNVRHEKDRDVHRSLSFLGPSTSNSVSPSTSPEGRFHVSTSPPGPIHTQSTPNLG